MRRPTERTSGISATIFSAMRPMRSELGQTYSGLQNDADQHCALVERRQERTRQQHAGKYRSAHRSDGETDDEGRSRETPFEARPLPSLQHANERRIVLGKLAHARQQPIAEHRRHGEGHDEAGEDRDDEGNAERREQAPLDARQRKYRQEDKNDDDGRVDDARLHLGRGRSPRSGG